MEVARIEEFEADQLLTLTGADANCALAQLVHEVDVGQLQQTEHSSVGRITAAVLDYSRPLFLYVDDDIVLFDTARRLAGRLLADQHLGKCRGHLGRRVWSASDGVDFLEQTILRKDLFAAHLDFSDAREWSFSDFESNDQAVLGRRNALQRVHVRMPVAEILHVGFDGPNILL